MATLHDTIQNLYEEKHFQTYRRFPLTLIKGKGTKVYDTEGKEYLDALAGIAVNNVGHCHPKVVKAIQDQAESLIHISNLYHNIPQSTLAKLITEVSGFDRVFFCNSGLEANEGAIKIARKLSEQKSKNGPIIYFSGCFHGRSITSIAMGKEAFQKGFGPLPKGFKQLPYNDIEALDKIENDTKAIFVECIQGEGGINIGNKDFLRRIGEICKEKDIILVVDEIQTGMGRTGKMFAYEHFNLDPDIITLAKGLGSGVPIGAILAKGDAANILVPGDHGSTFGGNPLACAAALANLEVILEENLLENTQQVGTYLLNQITDLSKNYKIIKEVRGVGLMIGVEFESQCRSLALNLMEKGLLVSCTALYVIRLVPPLILTREEADQIVSILKEVLDKEG
ncbi:MAG: aspartate aminotransferase family protein [Cyclobacteriaceae bacterium]|nr:aspartate aminotransferase family protein [Cyclobacteriaceae bacterium]